MIGWIKKILGKTIWYSEPKYSLEYPLWKQTPFANGKYFTEIVIGQKGLI